MNSDALADSFFERDSDRVSPTALCQGPWAQGACHGGPVTALIGRAARDFEPDADLELVRLTVELLRPVPIAPLRVVPSLLRPGKRVQLVGVELSHDDTVVARATVLRVKRPPPDVPQAQAPAHPLTPPGELTSSKGRGRFGVGITDALELRAAHGSFNAPGPAGYWFRLARPLFPNEVIDPLSRVLIAADFGNGTSSVLDIDQHMFINPDLTVHLHRLPAGEWVGSNAVTWLTPGAGGYADAALYDESGGIGRAVQSLYVSKR